MDSPTIGLLGPVTIAGFRPYLPEACYRDDAPKGAGGTPVTEVALELLRRGRRVVVFTLDAEASGESTLRGERLTIHVGPYTHHRGRTYFAWERRYLLGAVRQERPDVLSAHWTYEFALAAVASGIPHVVTAHDAPWTILRHNLSPYRLVRTAMAYHAARTAMRMVAVSPYVARHLRRYRFHPRRIDVIPNGLPTEPVGRADRRVADGTLRFAAIFSGGWSGLKNGRTLLRAFSLVRDRLPDARLAMLGEQCEVDGEADRWADAHGLRNGVEFLGRRPHVDVMDILAGRVDILVHPSLEESFGMPLVEAAATGVPVIAGRSSGAVRWVVGGDACGVLVDTRSPRALADAMVRLGLDEGGRRMLAERARSMVRERFDIAVVVDRYEAIFAELCASGTPAGR